MTNTTNTYRGIGTSVSHLNNDVPQILSAGGLNWRTTRMPLAIQGKREVRLFPDKVALVRSDNGHPLAVASERYQPHHNEELVRGMADGCNRAGLTIERVGSFEGGRRIWAIASGNDSRSRSELRKGDIVRLIVILRGGHEPGAATTARVMAERLVCTNGMTVKLTGGRFRAAHNVVLDSDRLDDFANFINAAAASFGLHMEEQRELAAIRSTSLVDRMLLAARYGEGFGERFTERFAIPFNTLNPQERENVVRVAANEDGQRLSLEAVIDASRTRLTNAILDSYYTQPGNSLVIDTLSRPVQAITHFNSNLRGRTAESGVESNWFGNAAADTTEAVEYIQSWAPAVRTVLGVAR